MDIARQLEDLRGVEHAGPAGPLRLGLRPPAAPEALDALRARFPLPLTGSYLAMLGISDGLDLFGVPVLGAVLPPDTDADAVADLARRRLVPFHDWGNGDFDCLDLTKVVDAEPPVVFWNSEHENLFPITHGFGGWLPMAVHEIARFGRLLHPRDYEDPRWADAQGVYESIANVRKTFYGGPEVVPRDVTPPPPPGRRERLKRLLVTLARR